MSNQTECESCNGPKPADSWKQVGEPELQHGGKGGDTTYSHYICNICGSRWVKIRDSGGLGGNETYYHREK